MYYLKNKNFPCPDVEGIHELEGTIPASYFRDFADNLPPEANCPGVFGESEDHHPGNQGIHQQNGCKPGEKILS